MNIEKLAQKLEPLMPQEIHRWLQIRDMADTELKELIEKQIISVAHKRLGDFRKKILLSLPPKQKIRGTFNLGTVLYEDKKWPAGISNSELMQNMAIFGRSGAGKTNVAFHLMEQLVAKKIPFLFLDWKRTARHLIPKFKDKINVYTPGRSLSKFVFNPFIPPPGLDPNVYVNHVVDIISEAYTLGEGSRSIIQKAIASCYQQANLSPSVDQIIEKVENMPSKGRVHGWKISALRALQSLKFSQLGAVDKVSQQEVAKTLLQENTIIELDALGQSAKKFLVPLLCLWLYNVKLPSQDREKLSLVIFIEEAHHLLLRQERRANETLMDMLLRQCREIGIGIVVVDQHPHLISSSVLGNSYTSICLNQKNPSDINKAAGISLVDDEDKRYFSMLPVGQAIVKLQDKWRKPFLVEFPLLNFQKGLVTDSILARYLRQNTTGSGRKSSVLPEFEQVSRIPLYDKALNGGAFKLLEDILIYPDDGVKIRYKRLGLSAGKGNRLKEQLLDQGWLETQVVEFGKTRKVLLRLAKAGKQALGLDGKNPERASLVHEYWKRFYAQRFREQGYKVCLEAPRQSGAVDVLAMKDGESVAVEIETGKSDIVRNVKQDLLSGFDKVLIVATDEKALETVEQKLAKEGLIGFGRVEVVLRDKSSINLSSPIESKNSSV